MKLSKLHEARLRRSLAAVLSSAMVLTSFSIPAYAEEMADVVTEDVAEEIAEEVFAEEESIVDDAAADEEFVEAADAEESVDTVSPNGVSGEDADTFVYDGRNISYDSTGKIISAQFIKGGHVKISWKIKGAGYAKVAAVGNALEGSDIVVLGEGKMTSFTDKKPQFHGNIYVVEIFDRSGTSMVGKYIVAPSTYIMKARNLANGDAELIFPAFDDQGFEYSIAKAADTKFKNTISTVTVSMNDCKVGTLGGRHTYTYIDKDQAFIGTGKTSKKVFYRITVNACAKIGDQVFDMTTKQSETTGLYGQRYDGPVIVSMNGVSEHEDGCYSGATLWFKAPEYAAGQTRNYIDTDHIRNLNTTYEVYKTLNGKTYTLVTSVKGNSLVINPDYTDVYGINLSNLEPEQTFSYAIRVIRNNKKSEYSNAYAHYFHFKDVEGLKITNSNANSVKLTWQTEQCATSYAIYRTIQGYSTVSQANAVVENAYLYAALTEQNKAFTSKVVKALGLKKAKTVKNDLRSGLELEAEINKLSSGLNYGFMVVPVNEKKYGYDDAAFSGASINVASPKSIRYNSKGTNGYKLTWSKTTKSTGYRLERLTVSENAYAISREVDDADGLGNWAEMYPDCYTYTDYPETTKFVEVTSGSGESMSTAKPGVTYIYRVLSKYSENGTTKVAAPQKDAFKEAVLGPKAVGDVAITMVLKDKSGRTYWDNTKDYRTPSGNQVGVGGIKLTFKVNDKKNTKSYEVQKSSDNGITYESFAMLEIGTGKDGKTYKAAATEIPVYDSGLKRGVQYRYRVRPVSADGTVGLWKEKEFAVASAWMVYSKNNSNYNNLKCTSKGTAMPMATGKTYRLYLEFNPSNTTVTGYKVTAPSDFEVVEQGFEEINNGKDKLYYVDVKTSDGASTGDYGAFTFKYERCYDSREYTSKSIADIKLYVRVQ